MQLVDKQGSDYLYSQVIDLISENIEAGTLRPGDRLPSLRKMSKRAGVSIPTVRQAYVELERQRRIESRPQSGFYVRYLGANPMLEPAPSSDMAHDCRECRPLMVRVYEAIHDPNLIPLGIANPTMARPAAKLLHRAMKRIMARAEQRSLGYAPTLGEPTLRRQIAYHYLDTMGVQIEPEQVAITNGAQEALLLALHTMASKGDVVAVETPTYQGMLELINSLGMLAIEVETCPEEGVEIDELRKTIEEHDVKACLLSTTLSNPLGVTMPDSNRRALVELLEESDVALVDDDVYGDLRFDAMRPLPAQFLGTNARIMTCGSFSKTAAPGYRIGWVVMDERYTEEIRRSKLAFSCSSGLLQQLTLADFMASGDYVRHLNSLRPVLKRNSERMSALVSEHFPQETRVSRPSGGSVLWLELPDDIDASVLFQDAIDAGISISPGPIFAPSHRYRNFIRLSYGHQWSERIDDAMRWLGQHVHESVTA